MGGDGGGGPLVVAVTSALNLEYLDGQFHFSSSDGKVCSEQ